MRGGRRHPETRENNTKSRGRGKTHNSRNRTDWDRGGRAFGSRRSLSPPPRDRDRHRDRNRVSPRRSASLERRGYDDSRFSDCGNLLQHGDVDRGSHGGGGRQLNLEKDYGQRPPNYMLPDHPSGLKIPGTGAGIDTFNSVKERDVGYLDMQSDVPQRSVFLDELTSLGQYSRAVDGNYVLDAGALKSDGMVGSSSRYLNVGVHEFKNQLSDPYDNGKSRAVYVGDLANNSLVGPSHSRPVGTVSSTGIGRDELLGSYDGLIRENFSTFERSHGSKLSDENLDKAGYAQVHLSGALMKDPCTEDNKKDVVHGGYRELPEQERDGLRFYDADATYRTVQWNSQDDMQHKYSLSFTESGQRRISGIDSSKRSTYETGARDQHISLLRDATLSYGKIPAVHGDFVGGSALDPTGLRMKSSRGPDYATQDEIYDFEQDMPHRMSYTRHRSPALSTRHVSMYERPITSPRRNSDRHDSLYERQITSPRRNLDRRDILYERSITSPRRNPDRHDNLYERPITSRRNPDLDALPTHHVNLYERPVTSPRMDRRGYLQDDAMLEPGHRRISRDNLTNFGRRYSRSPDVEVEPRKHRIRGLASKDMAFVHSKNKRTSLTKFNARQLAGGSPREGAYDQPRNLKRRLRHGGPSDFHGSYPSDRRKEFSRPKKFLKGDLEVANGGSNANDIDGLDEHVVLKRDPPEDSEEFKKQVDKAFLHYSKMLNENQQERKKYQGQASSLLCCVCESLSKRFSDAHCLVTHAYNSPRVGLRTKHLGLHKAICVLLGWNPLVAPTVTRETLPAIEAKALKDDLVLWPPLVVIHSRTIPNKSNSSNKKAMTNESLGEVLKDIGYGASNPKVCHGRADDNSIFLVKFPATFSGFQETERLHKHFAGKNHGREEFAQLSRTKSSTKGKDESSKKMEEILYGYMALAEDLHLLDDETKKRSVVKSKKAIEAIADAALNVD